MYCLSFLAIGYYNGNRYNVLFIIQADAISYRNVYMGSLMCATSLLKSQWDFPGHSQFQNSDIFQKAVNMAYRSILSVNSHLPGFKLEPGPAHAMRADIIKIGLFLPLKC